MDQKEGRGVVEMIFKGEDESLVTVIGNSHS